MLRYTGRKRLKERDSSPCFSSMSTATYRGVSYDTANYHLKQLEMIKRQVEKAQARYNAERVMAEKR